MNRAIVLLLAILSPICLASAATAATFTWDANGIFGDGNQDGAGTWSTGNANWNNGIGDVVWPNSGTNDDAAVFGVGSGAAGAVNVSGTVNVNGITFNAPGSGNYTIGGTNLTLNGATPTITTNTDATIGAPLSGSGGLGKSGAGTLTLSGASSNTYSGTTTLTGPNGQLVLSKTGGAVAVPGDMYMSATGVRAILSTTQDNQFGPTSVLYFTGSGDTRLEIKGTTQTFAGIDSTGFIPGTFAAIQHSEFGAPAAVDATSALILNVPGVDSYTFGNAGGSAVVRDYTGGTVSLTKNGTGTQTLVGPGITYTGATAVSDGVLQIGDGTAALSNSSISGTSAVTVNSPGTIKWNNANDFATNTIANVITGSGTVVLQGQNGVGADLQRSLYDLSGNNSGFTGTLQLDRSILWNTLSANDVGSASIVVGDRATFATNAAITLPNNFTINAGAGWHHDVSGNDVVIGALRLESSPTLSGTITLNTTTSIINGDNTGTNSVIGAYSNSIATLSGVIQGPGDLAMSRYTAWNGGTATDVNIKLTGASSNTFTGKTVVDGQHGRATLNLMKTGGAVAIAANTTVQMGSATGGEANLRMGDDQLTGATVGAGRNAWDNQFGSGVVLNFVNASGQWMRFDLQGTNQTLAGLNAGTLATQAGAVIQNQNLQSFDPGQNATLTLDGSGTYVYNGYLRDQDNGGTTRKLNLVKNGTGTQTLILAGGISGTTTINDGTLRLYNSGLANGSSAVTVNGPGTFQFDGTTNLGYANTIPITLNNGGTLLTTNTGFNVLGTASSVTNSGATNITVTQTGGPSNRGMFLDGGLKGTGTVTITATNAGNGVNFRNNNSTFSGTLIVDGIASTTAGAGSGIGVGGATTGLSNADIELNGTMELLNQGIGWANTASGAFRMGALNGTGVMVGNFSGVGGVTTVTLGNTNNNGSFSGEIANGTNNTVHLVKSGTGTQTLSGVNTYSGLTTVNDGILNIQNPAALGTTAGGTVVNSGGTLELQGTIAVGLEPLTLNGSGFGGIGALHSNGGANSFAGPITLGSAAEIQTELVSLTLTGGISLGANTLTVDGPGETIVGGTPIIGTGGLTKNGSGTLD